MELFNGLGYLHYNGFYHGDLNASTIMLGPSTGAKIFLSQIHQANNVDDRSCFLKYCKKSLNAKL